MRLLVRTRQKRTRLPEETGDISGEGRARAAAASQRRAAHRTARYSDRALTGRVRDQTHQLDRVASTIGQAEAARSCKKIFFLK